MRALALIELASELEEGLWNGLLARVNALKMFHHLAHWKTQGESYYSDHLLFERLYKETDAELDGVAEKAIGSTDDASFLNPTNWAAMTTNALSQWWPDGDKQINSSMFPAMALKAEKDFVSFVSEMKVSLEGADMLTDGIDNFLQGIADKHESHIYLLQQRIRNG